MKRLVCLLMVFVSMTVFAETSGEYRIECTEGDRVVISLDGYFNDEGKTVVDLRVEINGFPHETGGNVTYYIIENIQREQTGRYVFTRRYSDGTVKSVVVIIVVHPVP